MIQRAKLWWSSCKRLTKIQLALAAFGALFLLILVPTAGIVNTAESNQRQNMRATTAIDPFGALPLGFNGLAILLNVSTIDPNSFTTKIQMAIVPVGSFVEDPEAFILKLARQVTVTVNNVKTVGQIGDSITFADATVDIGQGEPNKYPFDKYICSIFLFATSTDNITRSSVPIALSVTGAIQSWNIVPAVSEYSLNGNNDVQVDLFYARSWTTKFFSIFVAFTMWLLSLTITVLASTLWFRDRKVEPPTIAVSAGLLFALPGVRNIQPGAPVVGCTADVVSFFWAMLLVALSTFLLMLNYIVKYRKEHSHPKVDKKHEDVKDSKDVSQHFPSTTTLPL